MQIRQIFIYNSISLSSPMQRESNTKTITKICELYLKKKKDNVGMA